MNFYFVLIVAVAASMFAMRIGPKLIEEYLGRKSEEENKIFPAGVRVAAIVLLWVLPAQLWPNYYNPIISTVQVFSAMIIGDLVSQSLFGRRVA